MPPSNKLSFETFLHQVIRVREVMLTPASRGELRELGVDPARLLERISVVERIGAAMTPHDRAHPTSLTIADKERVSRASGVSVAGVDHLLDRFRRAVRDDADSG